MVRKWVYTIPISYTHLTVGAVEHPMVDVHHIQWLFVETENGGQLRYLAPGQAPKAVFELVSEKPVSYTHLKTPSEPKRCCSGSGAEHRTEPSPSGGAHRILRASGMESNV